MAKYALFLCAFTFLAIGAFAEENAQSDELTLEQAYSTDQEDALFACSCGRGKKPQGPTEIACGCKKSKKPEGTAYNSNNEYVACECEVGGQEGEDTV